MSSIRRGAASSIRRSVFDFDLIFFFAIRYSNAYPG